MGPFSGLLRNARLVQLFSDGRIGDKSNRNEVINYFFSFTLKVEVNY